MGPLPFLVLECLASVLLLLLMMMMKRETLEESNAVTLQIGRQWMAASGVGVGRSGSGPSALHLLWLPAWTTLLVEADLSFTLDAIRLGEGPTVDSLIVEPDPSFTLDAIRLDEDPTMTLVVEANLNSTLDAIGLSCGGRTQWQGRIRKRRAVRGGASSRIHSTCTTGEDS
uniref:Uncharacterized protein n=1 Tax=Oryza brachyantha TaxID=4533 RepID=J3MLX7_ORYBR